MVLCGNETLVVYGGIGDEEDSAKDDAWAFNLTSNAWTKVGVDGPRPHKRFHHAAAARRSPAREVYIFGGMSVWQALPSPVLHYAQTQDLWRLQLDATPPAWVLEPAPNGPSNRSEATAITFNDRMYLFGGIEYDTTSTSRGHSRCFNDIWTFDYTTKVWTQLPLPAKHAKHVPSPRFSHAASTITVDGVTSMVIFGGRQLTKDDGWALLDDIWLFSFETHAWTQVHSTPAFKRAYTTMVTVDNDMWLFGGYFKSDYSTNGYVYDDTVHTRLSGTHTQFSKNNETDTMDEGYPSVRYLHRAVAWQGKMVVFGGRFQHTLGDMWVQDLNASLLHPVTDVHELERSDMNSLYVACVLFAIFTVFFVLTLVRFRLHHVHPTAPLRLVPRGVSNQRLLELKTKKYHAVASTETNASDQVDLCPICLQTDASV
ncbi:hypothetical protein SPRG_04762 [Saprolegnia parasitica CBS 223.65]|uniref:RING finger protein B n=1 Tax=Saprolegnia parasitica (strain CBS 223.65) TaxID=695850 RepID=A0A067CNP5_SAPPC|nr:hypothetical protein SPRG_04762 [Saprolegnia parasitica CBS 223.65]KDO30860.1 hypothetical protein SPRG_04762 [Saprolegnia parasitica CBS 223.65]|eukprot:XP_012198555.1 hypothetical protein SPRG_04762 [Saprolegnia parasitica CBS 223.65]